MPVKKPKLPVVLVGTEDARVSCVRCGASCRQPFGVRVEPESAHQILTSRELRALLTGRSPKVLADGWLPMLSEPDLRCVFLGDGHECRVRSVLGEAGMPRSCREFPITRVEDEQGSVRVAFRRGCAGVGKGNALDREGGPSLPISARLGLSSGRTLSRDEYAPMLTRLEELLADRSPQEALASAFRWFETVTGALEGGASPSAALSIPTARVPSEQLRPRALDWRLFLLALIPEFGSGASSLFSAGRPSLGAQLRKLWTMTKLAVGVGRVRVFGGAPVSVRSLRGTRLRLDAQAERELQRFLIELVERRTLFVRKTYLLKSLVELAFVAVLVVLVARARAAVAGRMSVLVSDIHEGCLLAESFVAAQLAGQSIVALEHLRTQMLAEEPVFFGFLARI